MSKTVITCAVTGAGTRPDQTPHLPILPREIADSALEAYHHGAAILHIHVRDPITGAPSMKMEYYREVVERIRDKAPSAIINLTTGPGANLPHVKDAMQRTDHVRALKPELCTLDLNTMLYPNDVVRANKASVVHDMYHLSLTANTRAEFEIFNAGDVRFLRDAIPNADSRCVYQLALGIKYGFEADTKTLHYARSLIPQHCIWSAFGIGKNAFPILAQTMMMGGHVRIGMEDTIYISKGELARSNWELVAKAARIIRDLGGDVATADEAREYYCLPPK